MFYFSVHFNYILRLPDSHCLTRPGTYTKAPPTAEVWGKTEYNLIPLQWAHVKTAATVLQDLTKRELQEGKDPWTLKTRFLCSFSFF